MTEPIFVDGTNPEEDALRQAVESYKEALRNATQDLDFDFLVKTLRAVKESDVVKVARNPVLPDRYWNSEATLFNVRSVDVDDAGHLVVKIRKDETEYTVGECLERLQELAQALPSKKAPVIFKASDEKDVQLTDAYAHMMNDAMYRGMPIDLVLGYYEKD